MLGKVAAAETRARIDRWKLSILSFAKSYASNPTPISPSVMAALISRETAGLDRYCFPPPKGVGGDAGHGWGPCQIDIRAFPKWCDDWKAGRLQIQNGIAMGYQVLNEKINRVKNLLALPLKSENILRYAIAAYNCGEGNVRRAHLDGLDIDAFTTGKNYSKDVLDRASYFLENGYR